jgi:hypothetical protein
MLTIKNRLMATAVMLAVAAPAFLLMPSAEAATSTVVIKQSLSGNLIADRYNDDYEYSDRHGRYINRGRYRRHYQKKFKSNGYYQTPAVIYNKPVGIYAPPPQIIYAPAQVPQERRCVRTLYSTICN